MAQRPAAVAAQMEQPQASRSLAGWAVLWTLLGVFAGGMALNLTPCVYPLIPVTVSFFGGRSDRTRTSLAAHGLCYIGGLALINSSLGVSAAFTGGLMGAMLQHPAVLILVASVLLVFAASLFGLWELRLPYAVTQAASKSYAGYFGSLFLGLTMGVVAAPCIGPFIFGLLTWVAALGNPALGFLIFLTLSLGLGLPLFVLAMFSGQLQKLPRSGEWMLWVRKLMGWVLVGMAAFYIRPLLPATARALLLAAVVLAAGIHLGWIIRSRSDVPAFDWLRTAVVTIAAVVSTFLVGSWVLRGPGVDWQPYSNGLLAEARRQGKAVVIDFYADWCTPCVELEEKTFHHPGVVQEAKRNFVTIKVNLTRKGNPINGVLLRQYDVKGVPTVVLIDPNGQERVDLRLLDFEPPDRFLIRMEQVKTSGSARQSG